MSNIDQDSSIDWARQAYEQLKQKQNQEKKEIQKLEKEAQEQEKIQKLEKEAQEQEKIQKLERNSVVVEDIRKTAPPMSKCCDICCTLPWSPTTKMVSAICSGCRCKW